MAAESASASFDAYLESRPLPLVAVRTPTPASAVACPHTFHGAPQCVGLQHLHSALSNRQHAAAADELVARYLSLESATSFLDYKEGDEQHEAVVVRGPASPMRTQRR